MIRLVVLGSGGSMPTKNTLPAGFALKYGGIFLFDCPEATQVQLLKYGMGFAIDAIFLSHMHADHFLGIFGLTQTMGLLGRKEELKVYGPPGTKAFLTPIFAMPHLKPAFPITIKDVSSGIALKTKLFNIKAFKVEHGCPALGYVLEEPPSVRFDEKKAKAAGIKGRMFTDIQEKGKLKVGSKTIKLEDVTYQQAGKKIVFTGDSMPCTSIVRNAQGADLLIHDSCFVEKDGAMAKEKHHSTAKQAAETALKARAKKLLLSHISNRYEDRSIVLNEARETFQQSALAAEGWEMFI